LLDVRPLSAHCDGGRAGGRYRRLYRFARFAPQPCLNELAFSRYPTLSNAPSRSWLTAHEIAEFAAAKSPNDHAGLTTRKVALVYWQRYYTFVHSSTGAFIPWQNRRNSPIFSERDTYVHVRYMLSAVRLSSVCRLSVCDVGAPYSAG